ncbi:hypothetical protein HD553DRAFT_328469 [Filobasidium floriforme]|uniref:uncharacterized protein n=1 Tax=Filobasidium floriforme TaxID=5210 RepID=UPI001E8D8DF3|nr:uncharacterized protein HD553DRAFT_328469 [Filobasidium floriforme]KAH8087110.1 hypothetical protein HD553DRAFT_328469 [Filobasidium floriforme]
MSSAAATTLSPALKALINAPHARGAAIPTSPHLSSLFKRIEDDARSKDIGIRTWLCLSTASLVTMNSPAAVCDLYSYATRSMAKAEDKAMAAAVMRETGLKCISFSGTINALGALRAHLEDDVKTHLSTEPTRQPTPENIESISARARDLWDSIYDPHSSKLLSKLSCSHPDLPVHILNSHYGALLSDPPFQANDNDNDNNLPGLAKLGHAKIGRTLTSVVAIACLRAQQGVGPQVTSHVFGLKKSVLEGGGLGDELPIQGQAFLASDEGAQWVLRTVDEVVASLRPDGSSSFAATAKL